MDTKNNYFMADGANNRIIKIQANNTSIFSVVGVSNTTLNYSPTNVFVDYNGIIYTAEYRVSFFCSIYPCTSVKPKT
jgi:hypothetical protein